MKWLSLGFLAVCALGGIIWCLTMLVAKWPYVFAIGMILLLSCLFGMIFKNIYDYRKLK